MALLAQFTALANAQGTPSQIFRATYVGNFQQLVDDNCEAPPPVVQLFCRGKLKPMKTSDSSIRCESVTDDEGWNGIECVNQCQGDNSNCDEEVFLVKNGKSEGGVFAEIQFQCTGESQEDVRAYMNYKQGEAGKCRLGLPRSRNYHVSKLGVLCSSTGEGKENYEFGTDFFNCKGGVFSQFGNSYACYTGDNCNGRPCKVDFENLVISSNSQTLDPACIQSEEIIGEIMEEPARPDDYMTAEKEEMIDETDIANDTEDSDANMSSYSVRYMGRFHQIMSEGCAGSRPRIMAVCKGDVEITSTSHPSIECSDMTFTLNDGRSAKYCENKCIGFECDTIYLSTTFAGNLGSPNFGQVYFTCSGSNVEDVDGSVIIAQPDDTSVCDGSDEEGTSLNVAQLAVVCPTDEGLRYVIDDRHSECAQENHALRYGTYYSCSSGGTCFSEDCEIKPQMVEVNADPHLFQECIEAATGSLPVSDIPAPMEPQREAGLYTATFVVSWLTIMDSQCKTTNMNRRISCTNGKILPIDWPHDCSIVDESTIDCPATDIEKSEVTYECTSDSQIPETYAEFMANITDCTQHTSDHVAWPALQLGVLCGDDNPEVVVSDWYAECGGDGAEFDVDEDDKPFCYTAIPVPEATDRTFELAKADFTGKLEIMTDYRWSHYASPKCYQMVAARRGLRGAL